MTYEPRIEKVLVVLSPDLVRPDRPMQSTLLKRAVALAKITGCELELFHVCYDSKLENELFASEAEKLQHRASLTDRAALQLAEIATRLNSEGIETTHQVRWDSPRSDAILRKIAEAEPDIVMKHGREPTYLLGISSNTDWELARRSPAHVWLVNEETTDIDRIVAAVGNKLGDPEDVTTATDHELLRTAGIIGETFKADVYPVNAFRMPPTHIYASHIGGTVAPLPNEGRNARSREQTAKRHGEAVEALARFVGIPKSNVHIREGEPSEVIPEIAGKLDADMIVMGASSISRLERMISTVTVEPVIAAAGNDILIVRERDLSGVPSAKKQPMPGVPQYELEHAITRPDEVFESPREVVDLEDVSVSLRKRILQAWEYDMRAEMTAANEGGPVAEIDYEALDKIISAKALLDMKSESGDEKPELLRKLA